MWKSSPPGRPPGTFFFSPFMPGTAAERGPADHIHPALVDVVDVVQHLSLITVRYSTSLLACPQSNYPTYVHIHLTYIRLHAYMLARLHTRGVSIRACPAPETSGPCLHREAYPAPARTGFRSKKGNGSRRGLARQGEAYFYCSYARSKLSRRHQTR